MRIRTWSRSDQLFLEGLLWALPAVALLGLAADGLRALRGGPLTVTGALPDDLAPTSELVTGPMTGTVVVEDPSTAQYVWDLAPSVVLLVLAVVVAQLLLGVARGLRTGDPFTTGNARRLVALGTLLIVGGALVPVLQGIAFEAVLDPLLPEGPRTWTLDLSVWPVLSGVLVGFLAEVFSRGARLREDVEGLV